MKKDFILTIAGGGSTYTPGIVKSLLLNKENFKLRELRMYDIDKERQEKVAVVVQKVIEQMDPELKLILTTDPKTAFENSDFIDVFIKKDVVLLNLCAQKNRKSKQ